MVCAPCCDTCGWAAGCSSHRGQQYLCHPYIWSYPLHVSPPLPVVLPPIVVLPTTCGITPYLWYYILPVILPPACGITPYLCHHPIPVMLPLTSWVYVLINYKVMLQAGLALQGLILNLSCCKSGGPSRGQSYLSPSTALLINIPRF